MTYTNLRRTRRLIQIYDTIDRLIGIVVVIVMGFKIIGTLTTSGSLAGGYIK